MDALGYVSGWVLDGKGWWYCNSDGTWPAGCWKLINNKWYTFSSGGALL